MAVRRSVLRMRAVTIFTLTKVAGRSRARGRCHCESPQIHARAGFRSGIGAARADSRPEREPFAAPARATGEFRRFASGSANGSDETRTRRVIIRLGSHPRKCLIDFTRSYDRERAGRRASCRDRRRSRSRWLELCASVRWAAGRPIHGLATGGITVIGTITARTHPIARWMLPRHDRTRCPPPSCSRSRWSRRSSSLAAAVPCGPPGRCAVRTRNAGQASRASVSASSTTPDAPPGRRPARGPAPRTPTAHRSGRASTATRRATGRAFATRRNERL